MSTAGGPKIVSDGLVLCLDAHDAKSYAGEPTTNMITDGDCNDGNVPDNMHFGYNKTYSVVDCPYDDDGFRPANKAIKFVKTDSTDGRFTFLNISSLSTGTSNPYVVSCWVYIPTNSTATVSSGRPRWNTDNSGNSAHLSYIDQYEGKKGKWARVSSKWYSVNGSQTHGLRGISGDPTGSIMYITNVQNEFKSYTTPFVDGSRSATNGWVDRTGSNNGTLTNMVGTEASHRRVGQVIEPISNAYLNFDGSNDYVATSFGSGRNPYSSPTTFVAWVKSDTTTANKMWLDHGSNGSNQRLYSALITADNPAPFGIQNSAWGLPSSADTSKWYHQALVMDSGTARGYYDGIAAGTKSYTSYTLPGNTRAGGRSSYIWDGQIASFAIYDKALSAAEIKANFNAHRRRFGV